MSDPISISSKLTKFFEPGSSSTKFQSGVERKVYLAASIVVGILTVGLVHAAYYGIKGINNLITKNDPDDKKVEVNIDKGKIQIKVKEPAIKVSGPNQEQNDLFKKGLLSLIQGTSNNTSKSVMGFTYGGVLSNGQLVTENDLLIPENDKLVAGFDKESDGRIIFFRLYLKSAPLADPAKIVVNGKELAAGELVYLKDGKDEENEIQVNNKTVFKFTLPPR